MSRYNPVETFGGEVRRAEYRAGNNFYASGGKINNT